MMIDKCSITDILCEHRDAEGDCLSSEGCSFPAVQELVIARNWSEGLGRPPEERTPEVDMERIVEFSNAMIDKWQAGRSKHGAVVSIDPLEEAEKECLDLANYAMDSYYRIQKLREKLQELRK